jgi:DNA-binding response OmpR family regulator
MSKPRVLVVEDDHEIADVLRRSLRIEGYDVKVSGDGNEALQEAGLFEPDAVVLDLGLPGLDGLDVMRELRRSSTTPVIMLTARAEEADRIVGLELGADDYVVKPFSPRELVARVRAVLRRVEPRSEGDLLRAGDVEVDLKRMRATVSGQAVELTPTEFQLLAALVREPGRVFTRSQLLDTVHGVAFESFERAIDSHIKNIRRKLEPEPARPRYIQTVHGVGYRFAGA